MAEISNNNTGLSGEYFVAAELYRRGWSVGLTIGNAKSVDLFAEKDNVMIKIQVKSIYQKKNVGWPILPKNIIDNCFYVFVNLNADKMGTPEYFICTSNEIIIKELIKDYGSRGIINLRALETADYMNNWKKLEQP